MPWVTASTERDPQLNVTHALSTCRGGAAVRQTAISANPGTACRRTQPKPGACLLYILNESRHFPEEKNTQIIPRQMTDRISRGRAEAQLTQKVSF